MSGRSVSLVFVWERPTLYEANGKPCTFWKGYYRYEHVWWKFWFRSFVMPSGGF